MINYELMQKEYPKLKAKLTRAVNGRDAAKILAAALAGLAKFDELEALGCPYPDDWNRWQRAKEDAMFALARGHKTSW